MSKIYFKPYAAIRYIGEKEQEFTRSLARPKPIVKKGDVCIVTVKDGYNLCRMLPTLWEKIDCDFLVVDGTYELEERVKELEEKLLELESENEELTSVVAVNDLAYCLEDGNSASGTNVSSSGTTLTQLKELENETISEQNEDNSNVEITLNDVIKDEDGTINLDKTLAAVEEKAGLKEKVVFRTRESFSEKDDLEEYARGFEVELDKRKSLDNMYQTLVDEVNNRDR